MKKRIKKLLYSSLIAFMMSIGYFDAEARVTKEVAEAVLPYLMKAAGIPQDPSLSSPSMTTSSSSSSSSSSATHVPNYSAKKQKAILDMIYTDEGQQQMVKWVKMGEFPNILKGTGEEPIFRTENTYADEEYRKVSLASLFPCQTDTFTSFAANSNRLGYYALKYGLVELIGATVLNIVQKAELMNTFKVRKETSTLENILTNLAGNTIDLRIAKIIFLLDICDTMDQLKNIIHKAAAPKIVEFDTSGIPVAKYNEYDCRPVPATMAQKKNNEGDCIESLYRHIIAIATQISNSAYFLNNLPPPLRFESLNKCGLTNVDLHEIWAKNLNDVFLSTATENCKIQEHIIAFIRQSQIPCFLLEIDKELKKITDAERKKIANGTIENLTDVIEAIAFYEGNVKKHHLDIATRLSDSLNKITASSNRFEVLLLPPSKISDICMPSNTNNIIMITEHSDIPVLNRTILVAICENLHAEIISIGKR